MSMKRPALAALVLAMAAEPAAAKLTWRGNMCITAISAACPAGDWVLTCYDLAFRPPNVSDNGTQTLFAFGDTRFRYGLRLASGSLVGTTYKAVTQTSITTFAFSPPNTTMRFTTQTPATITATTPNIYMVGNMNNVDGTPNCNLAFRASAVLSPN